MAIEGHTDDRGPDDYNLHLSQARANSVMAGSTSTASRPPRLEAHGYGETQPIADNKTDEGRTANRRVEFKILDEDEPGRARPRLRRPRHPRPLRRRLRPREEQHRDVIARATCLVRQ